MFTAKDRTELANALDAMSRLILNVAELNGKIEALERKIDEALDNPVDDMQAGIDAIMNYTGEPKRGNK